MPEVAEQKMKTQQTQKAKGRRNPPTLVSFPERVTVTMTKEMYEWVEEAAGNAGYTKNAAFLRDLIDDYRGK